MTTEKIMEKLLIVAGGLDESDRKVFDAVRKEGCEGVCVGIGAALGELYAALEEQFRVETAKKLGRSSVKHGMESILRSAKRTNPNRVWLQYAHDDGDYQVACNAYMIAALNKGDHVPLPGRPDGDAYKWALPNWVRSIPWDCVSEGRLVELPDLSALKLHLKSEKLKHGKKNPPPIIFDFGAKLPYIKVEYLIAALEILPGAKAYYAGHKNLSLLLANDNGSAVYIMGAKPGMERARTEI